VTDPALYIAEAELVDRLFDSAAAADPSFHRVEHAFYRLGVQETSTSAREFGQRLVIHRARDDNNTRLRHARVGATPYFSHLTSRSYSSDSTFLVPGGNASLMTAR